MQPKVLLIDDDEAFRKTLTKVLPLHGFQALEAGSGKAGIALAARERPDLILLDLVMPGMKGLEVCQVLKQDPLTAGIPVLILTGNDQQGLDIACLDMGADDYLTKPVKAERLLAHCRALLRRVLGPGRKSLLELGPLLLDHDRKIAALGGTEFAHLTPKEFGLLYDLAIHSPQPRERGVLYREIWGMEPPSEGSLRTVEVHVRRIRLKLGWRSSQWLQTVSGRGYCLVPPLQP